MTLQGMINIICDNTDLTPEDVIRMDVKDFDDLYLKITELKSKELEIKRKEILIKAKLKK